MATIITFDEEVDTKQLRNIIKYIDNIYPTLDHTNTLSKDRDLFDSIWNTPDKKQLCDILKKMYQYKTTKSNKVEYRYASYKHSGRLFAIQKSLQSIQHQIRHTIAKDIYYDVDIVNAHPNLLSFYCKTNNILCPCLDYYIINRDELLNSTASSNSVSKDQVKVAVLTVMNGGTIENIGFLPEWFNLLNDELKTIMNNVANLTVNNKLYKKICKTTTYNTKGKLLNFRLCEIENDILMSCIEFCTKNNIKVGTPIFDGFMMYKQSCLETSTKLGLDIKDWNNKFLTDLSAFILTEKKISLKFLIKPMNKGIDLSQYTSSSLSISDDEFNELKTESGCADFILSKIKDNLYYNKLSDNIYFFNENKCLYEIRQLDSLFNEVQLYIKPILEEKLKDIINDPDCKKEICEIKQLNKRYLSHAGLKSVVSIMKQKFEDKTEFIDDNFDKNPDLFPIAGNKVINFKTLSVRDRQREDYFTKTTDNVYLLDDSIDCKTNKTTYDDDVKKIYTYIGELLGTSNKHYIEQFLTVNSYFLSNYNSWRYFPIFTGSGSNGKSAYMGLLESILGDFEDQPNKKIFVKGVEAAHNTEVFSILNKRLIVINEADSYSKFNEGFIKNLTGDDYSKKGLKSRKAGSPNEVSLKLNAKMLGIFNTIPNLSDDALCQRLLVFLFPNSFSASESKKQEIYSFKNTLFTLLCNFLHLYIKSNFTFVPCSEIQVSTNSVRSSKDGFQSFIEQNIIINKELKISDFKIPTNKDWINKWSSILRSKFNSSYMEFIQTNNFDKISPQAINLRFDKLGIKPKKDSKGIFRLVGIRLRTAEDSKIDYLENDIDDEILPDLDNNTVMPLLGLIEQPQPENRGVNIIWEHNTEE